MKHLRGCLEIIVYIFVSRCFISCFMASRQFSTPPQIVWELRGSDFNDISLSTKHENTKQSILNCPQTSVLPFSSRSSDSSEPQVDEFVSRCFDSCSTLNLQSVVIRFAFLKPETRTQWRTSNLVTWFRSQWHMFNYKPWNRNSCILYCPSAHISSRCSPSVIRIGVSHLCILNIICSKR